MFAFFILCVNVALTAFAGPVEVKSPHGLGTFYEEPDGYRPALKGVHELVAFFEGTHLLQDCYTKEEIPLLITGALAKHSPAPKLGFTGPEDYPQIHFVFSATHSQQIQFKASIDLFLPAEVAPKKGIQKVRAFDYQYETSVHHATCKEDVERLITPVIDLWMAEYGRFHLEK